MMRYKIEAIVEDDRDEGTMPFYVEGVLAGHWQNRVEDFSVRYISD